MTTFLTILILWLAIGAAVEWRAYRNINDIIAFYKLPAKVGRFYPILGAIAWPAIVYWWIKK